MNTTNIKKRRRSIKMYKSGKCLVVEDRTPLEEAEARGDILPEEKRAIFGNICRKGKMMNGPDAEEFLNMFVEILHFLGASNAGVIMGHDHFMSPVMLQYKLLEVIQEKTTPTQQFNFDFGNTAEPFVADMVTQQMRSDGINVRFEDCLTGCINTMCPVVLVHADGFLVDRDTGERVLAEIKTAVENGPYWAYFRDKKVPLAYYDQAQCMMAVMEIPVCWFLVYNKTGNRDAFTYLKVERDRDYGRLVLETMMRFWKDTFINGKLWDDVDILPGEENVLYAETDKSLGFVTLPKKSERVLKEIDVLQEERNRLLEEKREIEADLRENGKALKLQKGRLMHDIRKAPGGTLTAGGKTYRVEKKVSFSKDQEAIEMLAKEDPEAYEALMKGYEGLRKIKQFVSVKITSTMGTGDDFTSEVTEIE